MQRRVFSLWRLVFFVALVGSLSAGCNGCKGEQGTNDFFDPAHFGEFEFDGEPDIEGPQRLLFGDLEIGETGRVTTEIKNVGRETLKINDWTISDGFILSFADGLDAPAEIRPGGSVIIGISFFSNDDEEHRGTLMIDSNDPDESEFVIDLFVNAKFPCLETLPDDAVDYGEVDMDERVDRTIVVRNCSPNAPTTFELLGLRGDPEFSFSRDPGFETMTLEVGESIELVVGFQPPRAGAYTAKLHFQSDDEFRPEHAVELRGRGSEGKCPNAGILGTSDLGLGDFNARPNATFETIPLDRLKMKDASVAYDGKILDKWEWSLISKPADSAASLVNPLTSMEQEMFLDLAGTYVIEMKVWDNQGAQSCDTARVTIHAVADEDIHIQLVWDTPNDPNQDDSAGSDVDLHLLHPNAGTVWNDNPWDCFWQNLIPDWGTSRPPGVDSFDCERQPDRQGCHDDPSLDIDDVNGWGPENINLNNPEPNRIYKVGVHYFSDHGYSVSFATVRIFIGGVMRAEYRRQRLIDQEFWHVADIAWPSGSITPKGQIYPSFP